MIGDLHIVAADGNRVHHLRYDNHALYRLTRDTKIGDPMVYFQELYHGKSVPIPSQADIVDLIWAGLLHKNRGATIDVALKIFGDLPGQMAIEKCAGIFPELATAIFKAMGQDLKISEPVPNETSPKESTGMSYKSSVPDSSGSPSTSSGE